MKKTILAASVAAVIATTGAAGLASAATAQSTDRSQHMSGLITALAKRFNVKENDVQAVFDENHSRMEVQREAEAKNQVTQLVKDGKLTQAQADLTNAKRTELQKTRNTYRTRMSSKTDTERKAGMDAERATLEAWFTDSGIPTEYRYLIFGGRQGHGDPGNIRTKMKNSATSSRYHSTRR